MTVVNSRGGDLVTTVWAEFGVATFVLSLRIYTTFQLLERVNPWAKAATLCAVLAWASNRSLGLLSNIFVELSVINGTGLHLADIPLTTLPAALLYSSVANFMSRICIATGKVSVILFLCAIQRGVQTAQQRILLGFIAISNICISIGLIFTIMFQCSPPRKLWHPEVPGSCNMRGVNNHYSFFMTAWGAATDLVLAVYPTFLFWSLQMERKTKVGMSILCGLGVVAAMCATVTCYQVHVLAQSSDPTWYKVTLTRWSFSEMWVIIIAASVPASWPWFVNMMSNIQRAVQRILSGSWRSRHKEAASLERDYSSPSTEPSRVESNREHWEMPLRKSSLSKGSRLTSEEIGACSPRSYS